MEGRTGQPTIPNILTIAGECSYYVKSVKNTRRHKNFIFAKPKPVIVEDLEAVNVENANDGAVDSSRGQNFQLMVDLLHHPREKSLVHRLGNVSIISVEPPIRDPPR